MPRAKPRLASGNWATDLLDQANDPQSLPPLHHAFTHFDLELQPLRLHVDTAPAIAEPDRQRWVTLSALPDLGLPAPIRKLIERHDTLL